VINITTSFSVANILRSRSVANILSRPVANIHRRFLFFSYLVLHYISYSYSLLALLVVISVVVMVM
jgi:hypothetical protein